MFLKKQVDAELDPPKFIMQFINKPNYDFNDFTILRAQRGPNLARPNLAVEVH